MSSDWIDISAPLRNGMVTWPGDAPFERASSLEIAHGDECNLSQISTSTHIGTHMDAPRHYLEGAAGIDPEAARYLVECRIQTVGVDYLSVGGFESGGPETHRILLEAGIWIIEGLQLEQVEPGDYELICLPLKIIGGDGAPARAVLRKLVL